MIMVVAVAAARALSQYGDLCDHRFGRSLAFRGRLFGGGGTQKITVKVRHQHREQLSATGTVYFQRGA